MQLVLRGLLSLLLLGSGGAASTSGTTRTGGASGWRARELLGMIRHQLGFRQSDLRHRLHDRFRVGNRSKAVRDGAYLDTVDFRAGCQEPRAGERRQREARERELAEITP